MNTPEGFYIDDYGSQLIIKNDFIADVNNNIENPYCFEYKILQKTENRYILMTECSDKYTPGLFSQLDYICGNLFIDGKYVQYFAYFFSAFDKKYLLDVCVPKEKDLNKYTFSVKHSLCSKYNIKYWISMAKKIKEYIIHTQIP